MTVFLMVEVTHGSVVDYACLVLRVLQPALAWTTFRVGLYCGFFIILAISFVLAGKSRVIADLIHISYPAGASAQFVMCHDKIAVRTRQMFIIRFPPSSSYQKHPLLFIRCCVFPPGEHLAPGADLPRRLPVDPVHLPVGHQHLRVEAGRSQPRAHL